MNKRGKTMLDVQQWSPWVVVCLAACGIGVLVVAGFFFRLGLNIVTDIMGGISGTQRARLPAPPPRPSFSPAPRAQTAPPPLMSFDEALARRQGIPHSLTARPPLVSTGQPMNVPSWPAHAPVPPQGSPPSPTVSSMPPITGFPLAQPPLPPIQPRTGSAARPSLSQGIPYQPPIGLPSLGATPTLGTPNNPFDARRRQRRLEDDRYEIYTDEDDAGGGLDMLL